MARVPYRPLIQMLHLPVFKLALRETFFCSRGRISTVLLLIVLALLVIPWGSMQAYATNTNYIHRPTGLVLPEKISFFVRGDIRDYDMNYPGMGTGIPYRFADIHVMVQVYDLKRNAMDIKVDDIKREVGRSVDSVNKKVRDGYYGNVELLDSPSVFRAGGGVRPVYMAGFTVNVGSKSFREYVYITSYKKHFVKVHITHPGSLSDDIVRNSFVNKLLSMLSGGDVKVKRPEPKRSKPRIKRSKHKMPHMEDLELYRK